MVGAFFGPETDSVSDPFFYRKMVVFIPQDPLRTPPGPSWGALGAQMGRGGASAGRARARRRASQHDDTYSMASSGAVAIVAGDDLSVLQHGEDDEARNTHLFVGFG